LRADVVVGLIVGW